MSSKRSKVLLGSSVVLLGSYGFTGLVLLLYLLYRMKFLGDLLETLLARAFLIGRLIAPLIILGLMSLAGLVLSKIADNRRKTLP
jgi:hypothetical protein